MEACRESRVFAGGEWAADVGNKLSARQYDEATWSTRSWLSFQTQRLSVALHLALAWEIGSELRAWPRRVLWG